MGRTLGFCVLAAATLLASPARADKFSETLDISVGARGAWLELDRPLEPSLGSSPPAVLASAEPRIHGTGQLWGAAGRIGLSLDGWRFGVGVGVMGAAHLRLSRGTLPEGMSLDVGRAWGPVFEGYVGYAIGDARSVQLIMEARGGLTVVELELEVHDPTLGSLGSHPWDAYLPNLDLRLGARVPIDVWAFVEAGVAVSPLPEDLVPERGSIFAAFGLPIPLAHL